MKPSDGGDGFNSQRPTSCLIEVREGKRKEPAEDGFSTRHGYFIRQVSEGGD
jgi:hypothetical protein